MPAQLCQKSRTPSGLLLLPRLSLWRSFSAYIMFDLVPIECERKKRSCAKTVIALGPERRCETGQTGCNDAFLSPPSHSSSPHQRQHFQPVYLLYSLLLFHSVCRLRCPRGLIGDKRKRLCVNPLGKCKVPFFPYARVCSRVWAAQRSALPGARMSIQFQ